MELHNILWAFFFFFLIQLESAAVALSAVEPSQKIGADFEVNQHSGAVPGVENEMIHKSLRRGEGEGLACCNGVVSFRSPRGG